MNLVFFDDCIQHLARISRILRQERGNAMLVGVGGSGRSSMARLAAGFNQMTTFAIEITKAYREKEFHDDIKTLLRKCALDEEITQFLFGDNQIVRESFLEDINNLLNSGEIPNLFLPDEKIQIIEELTDKAKAAGVPNTRENIYAYFVQLCRERLHIVLTFSPVGANFRTRCLQFPSIINCATIDWYNAWPKEALYDVAHRAYGREADSLGIGQDLETLASASVQLHRTVSEASDAFYSELRRRNYVTPTSYLELVATFVAELRRQKAIIPVKIQRYDQGLTRLKETNVIVDALQENLVKLRPEIDAKEKATQAMVVTLQEQTQVASEQEKITAKDEAESKKIYNEVSEIKRSCEEILSEAMPALHAATKALNTLDQKDIGEMKMYAQPPDDLVMVLNAVCLLKKEKQDWDTAKKLMGNPKQFLTSLQDFDKDNIAEGQLKKLKKFVNDPRFTPENIGKKSKAGQSICMWVRAMDKYSEVKRVVEPKKAALAVAEGQLGEATRSLQVKQAELQKVRNKIAGLEAEYNASQQELDRLTRQKQTIEIQLQRAEKLVVGLADESKRWAESIEELRADEINMLGNTVLASGFISYLGCFTNKYRKQLVAQWMKFCKESGCKYALDFSVVKILGDAVVIRDWQLKGLPGDSLSIDNGIIATSAKRWPLIIDPQSQGNKWIKNMEKENNLQVIKLSNPKFLNICDTSIRLGYSVLLENI
jgi:dynein heavy chain